MASPTTTTEVSTSTLPELSTHPAKTGDERILALKLVTDSVAQQRQTLSRTVVFHPATLAVVFLAFGILSHFTYKKKDDLPVLATTCIGVFMAFLVGIKSLGEGYIKRAEAMNWEWMTDETGKQDEVLVSQFGDEIMAAIIYRLVKPKKGKKYGLIKGWAVRLRYRGKGVGWDLLKDAVKDVKSKLGKDADVMFDEDHANAARFLPGTFNHALDKQEKKARAMLERALKEAEDEQEKK